MKRTPAERIWGGFKEHFCLDDIFVDKVLTNYTGKYVFDLNAFEVWLISQGYQPEEAGSIQDFIRINYGAEAANFIESLFYGA